LEDLSRKTRDYEVLLKDIENIVDSSTSERIKQALDKVRLHFFFLFPFFVSLSTSVLQII